METLNSFKSYHKMDPATEASFRQKTKRRIILIAISLSLLLLLITISLSTLLTPNKKHTTSSTPPTSLSSSLKSICTLTLYPAPCLASLSSATSADPNSLFNLSLSAASHAISKIPSFLPTLRIPLSANNRLHAALLNCKDLIDDAIDRLNESAAVLATGDIKTWLSAALADMETCLEGFEGTSGGYREKIEAEMANATQLVSNSLAIVSGVLEKVGFLERRKLLLWVGEKQRRVLVGGGVGVNVTVARDGTGDVRGVQEAVDLAPERSLGLFVIYVKEGEYDEVVIVGKDKWNVVMVGEGMEKTVITGSKNFVDGTPTFSTATFAVSGRNFIARDIKFRNTAGGEKHQAVALRSAADRSIFLRCSFDGFQDTLYVHSNRQFYRDCRIIGTVDFIFGDAAAVFQNCQILPRQPLPNQANTITAQGKKDPNENTGISIQGCTIGPYDVLTRPTFLGRPWKNYSTTVVMKTEIGSLVDPAGWLEWVPGVVPPGTINYAEYENTGSGAGVAGRVRWAGYRPAIGEDEAGKYTVGSFLDGGEWVAEAGVEFQLNL